MGHPEGARETCDVRVGFDTTAYGWKRSHCAPQAL